MAKLSCRALRQTLPIACGFLFTGAACSGLETADPFDAVIPDSPCYRVHVLDGFDDGDELQETFRCLDWHGHLASLRPTMAALDLNGGSDLAATILEGWSPTIDASLPLEAPMVPYEVLQELCTGQPSAMGLPSPWHSPLATLAEPVPALAQSLRDQPSAVGGLAEMLMHPSAREGAAAANVARQGPQGALVLDGLHRLALALHEGDADGALTGAVVDTWIVNPAGALPRSFPSLAALLEPPGWRRTVVEGFEELPDPGGVPGSLAWLASVNADGDPRGSDEPSALLLILRLLSSGNGPIDCGIDIGPLGIDWSFPNLSVRLLQLIAGMEPGTLGAASTVWQGLTDNLIADAVIDAAVASGTCPSFDHTARDGIDALDLLTAPETEALLLWAIPMLKAAEVQGTLPAMANLAVAIDEGGGGPAMDSWLRAVGPTQAARHVAESLAALSQQPPSGEPALLHGLDLFAVAVESPQSGVGAAIIRMYPVVRQAAEHHGVRDAAFALSELAAQPDAHSAQAVDAVLPLLAKPETWTAIEGLFADPVVVDQVLRLLTHPNLISKLLSDEGSNNHPPPLQAVAGLIHDGTIEQVGSILDDFLLEAQ